MKKLIIILFTVATFQVNSQTSSYHSFPDSNARWNIHNFNYCFNNVNVDEYYSIELSGDTVINCRIYHKLVVPSIKNNTGSTCGTINTGYQGAICQDSANRLVIFMAPGSHTEQLLYDFNMKVGDTVKGFLSLFTSSPDTIYSIDSVLVGSNFHKRWNISSYYDLHIIEGVGSTYGLIQPFSANTTDLPDFSVICFSQNGKTLYPDTSTNCEVVNSTGDIKDGQELIKVYPNPSQGSFNIDFGQTDDINDIQIADLSGRIFMHQSVNANSCINITNLPKGTYLLYLTDDEHRIIFRKLITRL